MFSYSRHHLSSYAGPSWRDRRSRRRVLPSIHSGPSRHDEWMMYGVLLRFGLQTAIRMLSLVGDALSRLAKSSRLILVVQRSAEVDTWIGWGQWQTAKKKLYSFPFASSAARVPQRAIRTDCGVNAEISPGRLMPFRWFWWCLLMKEFVFVGQIVLLLLHISVWSNWEPRQESFFFARGQIWPDFFCYYESGNNWHRTSWRLPGDFLETSWRLRDFH